MVHIARLKRIVLVSIAFLIGLVFSAAYASFNAFELQKPLGIFGLSDEKNSPSDRIKDYNILANDEKIVVYVHDPYLAKFTDTHSMEPVLDKKSTGIEITPKSDSEIKVGDIISYKPMDSEDVIIHRVVKIGKDSEGWYAVAKGDNNPSNDPGKIRFSQVKRILVGILY